MALTSLTVTKIFQYVDQKRIYTPQDGSSQLSKKYRALTNVLWDLKSEFQLPWDEKTTTLNYLDSVTDYSAPDGLDHIISFVPDSFDNFKQRIDKKTPEEFIRLDNRGVSNMFAVDMADQTKALMLKFRGQHNAIQVQAASDVDNNGTWTADTTNSDATNLTQDKLTFKKFGSSVNFDADVSQSANNRATVYVADMSAVDLSDESDVAHFVMDFYIPDTTYITSFDLFWSDESSVTPSTKSKYWTKNVTTQINGGAFQNGWNVLDFDWASATKTGSPGSSAIVYLEIRVNYSASQADDTDFRFNYIRAVIPEVVDVRYSTAYIAENSGGTLIDEIGATSDVMLFSQMDTKFMRTVIAGCLYELFGDDNTKGGTKESSWERRYTREKAKLLAEYPPRIKRVERRVNIRSTQRLQFV